MKAIVLEEFGPPENLRYKGVPDPVPGEGQVRIMVEVVGVHLIETAMREGLAIGPPLPSLPTIFGSEVAGVVGAIGDGVAEDWLGKRVVTAVATSGGYAELAIADISVLQEIPDGLDYRTAVAMIRTGATTIGMLDLAQMTPDDVVLVNSAAGGIGRLLVEYGKSIGAKVVGAAGGPEKVVLVEKLGADLAVDYNEPGWDSVVRQATGGVTVALDGVGGDKAQTAYDLLVDGGRFISIGSASRQDFEPPNDGRTYINALMTMLADRDAFPRYERRALQAAEDGVFTATTQAFPLSDAADAHRAMERRETSGKVILEP